MPDKEQEQEHKEETGGSPRPEEGQGSGEPVPPKPPKPKPEEGQGSGEPVPPKPPKPKPEEGQGQQPTPSTKLELKNVKAMSVSKGISISSVIKLTQLEGDIDENYKQASILAYSNALTIDEAIDYMVYAKSK